MFTHLSVCGCSSYILVEYIISCNPPIYIRIMFLSAAVVTLGMAFFVAIGCVSASHVLHSRLVTHFPVAVSFKQTKIIISGAKL